MRRSLPAMLLALSAASSTQASGFGRLFFTPEQRAQLEQERNALTEGEPPSSVLTVNGIVQQHGGARTVWINGVAHNSGNSGEPSAEVVAAPGKSPSIKIKVGQKLLPNNATPQSSPAPTE